jgi:hypothetical protein
MQKSKALPSPDYTVDLKKVKDEGEFPCPRCKALISPDDESDQNYLLLDTEMKHDDLSALLIECRRCNAVIRLEGFPIV